MLGDFSRDAVALSIRSRASVDSYCPVIGFTNPIIDWLSIQSGLTGTRAKRDLSSSLSPATKINSSPTSGSDPVDTATGVFPATE
ncbi:hypothetical protein D9M71_314760 [compost metagenome]